MFTTASSRCITNTENVFYRFFLLWGEMVGGQAPCTSAISEKTRRLSPPPFRRPPLGARRGEAGRERPESRAQCGGRRDRVRIRWPLGMQLGTGNYRRRGDRRNFILGPFTQNTRERRHINHAGGGRAAGAPRPAGPPFGRSAAGASSSRRRLACHDALERTSLSSENRNEALSRSRPKLSKPPRKHV